MDYFVSIWKRQERNSDKKFVTWKSGEIYIFTAKTFQKYRNNTGSKLSKKVF